MRSILVSAGYLALAVAAWRWTYSNSGWVVLGLVPVLWIDRNVFRLLPWKVHKPLREALALRLAYVLGGTCLLILIGYPRMELSEAAFGGLVVSLFTFVLELIFGWVIGPAPGRRRLITRVAGLTLVLVFLSPLTNFHRIRFSPLYTPGQLGLVYEDVALETADGLKLSAWLVPHPEPRGSVIVCHGLNGNREQFLYLFPLFHELGLNVLAFDFRGHGRSPGHTITFGAREVQDVLAAEDYLARRHPGQPILLYAVSYGGAVSLQTLPRLTHVQGAWVESSFSRFTEAAEVHFPWLPPGPRRGLIQVYSVLAWIDTGAWPPDVNPIDFPAQMQIPVCFCHGTADTLIPFPEGLDLYQAYPGPKRNFWMQGARHGDVTEGEEEEYDRRFRAFINDCLSATNR